MLLILNEFSHPVISEWVVIYSILGTEVIFLLIELNANPLLGG